MIKKKPTKLQKFVNDKGKWAIVSIVIFAIIGIVALLVGYAMQKGWDYVLHWFVSRWAIYVYIALGLVGFIVVWVVHQSKMKE